MKPMLIALFALILQIPVQIPAHFSAPEPSVEQPAGRNSDRITAPDCAEGSLAQCVATDEFGCIRYVCVAVAN